MDSFTAVSCNLHVGSPYSLPLGDPCLVLWHDNRFAVVTMKDRITLTEAIAILADEIRCAGSIPHARAADVAGDEWSRAVRALAANGEVRDAGGWISATRKGMDHARS